MIPIRKIIIIYDITLMIQKLMCEQSYYNHQVFTHYPQ